MKSQPEIKIRRLAVFGGYSENALGMAWDGRAQRESRTARTQSAPVVQLREPAAEPNVIRLEAVQRDVGMWHAA